jgi:sigma-B regulation protein RsbU (phosphoserine phosphatase)
VTLFYGVLNLATRTLLYGNAGHNYPILCGADGKALELSEGGLFLGPFPDASWDDSEVQLKSKDVLFIYTDGVTEAAIEKTDEQFGEERLKKYLTENCSRSPGQINQSLVGVLRDFSRSDQFDDDVTILTVKIL